MRIGKNAGRRVMAAAVALVGVGTWLGCSSKDEADARARACAELEKLSLEDVRKIVDTAQRQLEAQGVTIANWA